MSAAAAAPAADAAPKKGKKKLIIIVAAAVALLGIVGGGAVFYLKQKAAAEAAAAAAEEDGEEAEAHPAKSAKAKKDEHHAPPVFLPLDPFVVNLADREADRFAQVGITLEVEDAKVGDEIKAYMPAIRNNILLLLAHKTSQELMEPQGKEKLARDVRREALRPMGYDVPDEDEEEAEDTPKKKKKKKKAAAEDLPIKSVQFSSFIIQ